MARPKRLTVETTLRLDAGTVERLDKALGDGENRSQFIRAAIEDAIALREVGLPGDAREVLFANESLIEFCASAIRRLIEARRTMRETENAGIRDGGKRGVAPE
ncbi:MAG: hypothetical protein PHE83_16175 [Opitutaceae bacterium]|nr:hypothetical protein [Opitutaceae bacterium]